jgi:hypothetical protein
MPEGDDRTQMVPGNTGVVGPVLMAGVLEPEQASRRAAKVSSAFRPALTDGVRCLTLLPGGTRHPL